MEITYLGNSCFRIKSKKAIVLVGADSSLSSGITADIVCTLEDNGFKKCVFITHNPLCVALAHHEIRLGVGGIQ